MSSVADFKQKQQFETFSYLPALTPDDISCTNSIHHISGLESRGGVCRA